MKKIFAGFFIFAFAACFAQEKCPEGINLLPMYGNVKKCQPQLDSDQTFLEHCKNNFKTKEEASGFYVNQGWEYLKRNETDMAMKRFNQAWLIDNKNANVFWGFAATLSQKGHPNESIAFFEKSIILNPSNAQVWRSFASAYGQLFEQTSQQKYLDKMIEYLKKAVSLDPKDAQSYKLLAMAYSHFYQQDSTAKYQKISEGLHPALISK